MSNTLPLTEVDLLLDMTGESRSQKLSVGVYSSVDDGETWRLSGLEGLDLNIVQIAAHPRRLEEIGSATASGVYRSTDIGDTFIRVSDENPVTALTFSIDERIPYGFRSITAVRLEDGTRTPVPTPTLAEGDLIFFTATSPQDATGIAFATRDRHIYITEDGGREWKQIAEKGIPSS